MLVAPGVSYKSLSWAHFKPLLPPLDRFWADPFVLANDGKYYVFMEELLFSTNLGRIICLTLDRDMNILSNQVVLERPYHLSYPFVFEHDGQFYMIPETRRNNAIELYRCVRFPDQWEFEKTLIDGIQAVDATLLNHQGKWWLFASVQSEKGTTWDTLHIFHAAHPISEQWTPHPLNPVIKDITSARPAGRIFLENGNLIRPSQDCSVRYGYATNFNHITRLSETEYAEVRIHRFEPPDLGGILSVHTFNTTPELTVIDAEQIRPRLWG